MNRPSVHAIFTGILYLTPSLSISRLTVSLWNITVERSDLAVKRVVMVTMWMAQSSGY